ncbi:MAG: DNA adenine methylase [Candidatus Nanoarchaeia archaeon]|nr:DNA adenine methylase [Candidatus Nanoarchaeia archaeon]MDD5239160.1 DNA adenine methylase [Candidatus Nanoarchaeia archaeon]
MCTERRFHIKSPLRYPGGKSKALNQILPLVPYFDEFREPMVGGGSIFLTLKQLHPTKKFWINDLNRDLYLFWKFCKNDIIDLTEEIQKVKRDNTNVKSLYTQLNNKNKVSELKRAVNFFVLNRITFSGLAGSGGYSNESFKKRFTDSAIERLIATSKLLDHTTITNYDYKDVIDKHGKHVFIFLDPPYFSNVKSKLYGKNGDLHENFDHNKFAEDMKICKHKWLITYDDSQEIRDLFSFAYIHKWKLQYSMNNYKKKFAAKGNELFISNYELPSLKGRV